jgi:hypothetical protein
MGREKKQIKLIMIIMGMLMTGMDGTFILAIRHLMIKIMIRKIVMDGLLILFIIIVITGRMFRELLALRETIL